MLFSESAKISGVVLLIIALAGIFAWTGTTLGTFTKMAEFILAISDNPWVLLLLVMFLVLIAGMFLDAISIYLILTPIFIPFIQHFGWTLGLFVFLVAMNIVFIAFK